MSAHAKSVIELRGVFWAPRCDDPGAGNRLPLDLRIRAREVTWLEGPAGEGKEAAFKLLSLSETPAAGEVVLDGASVQAISAEERAHRTNNALKMVRMESFAKRYPAQLSGGQQQRIALARALVFEPKLVLMDEPLGALDKQLREHMQYELKSLHEKLGVTFVYVTHDQGEALTMSDRVAVFDKGIVQQLDTVDRLYESPCNEFVANFIGDSNKLRGTIANVNGEYCELHLADGTRVTGRNIGGARAGTPAIACIRPERMKLSAGGNGHANGAARPGANALAGEARGLIYFGDHVRMRCGLPQQDECFVKVPLGTDALNAFAPGAPVALEFAPEHLRVFAGA